VGTLLARAGAVDAWCNFARRLELV